jgi:uncharacterized membrane protein YfcA
MNPITALLAVLGVVTVGYLFILIQGLMRDAKEGHSLIGSPIMWVISFIMNFFDTLGIGSFATTTSASRAFKQIPDEKLPGSLNVGYVLPTVLQTFLFTTAVAVGSRTLISMIASAVLGAWLGAGVVARWPKRKIQIGMGLCLLGFAVIMLVRMKLQPDAASTMIELEGVKWIIGLVVIFGLGALMTLGIGLYGPCIVLISILGMNEKAAFPIMMGACAFLMPVASAQFIKARAYYPKAMLAMALAGLPAVWVAVTWFSDLPLNQVKYVIVAVVIYTGVSMLMSARRGANMPAKAA